MFFCGVCHTVLCCEVSVGELVVFFGGEADPFGVCFSGFGAFVVDSEFCSEFEGCFDYVAFVSKV